MLQWLYLLEEFSLADAALIAILNWARHVRMDPVPYPTIRTYYERRLTPPSAARAIADLLLAVFGGLLAGVQPDR